MEAPITADGWAHPIQTKGVFKIEPNTAVCRAPRIIHGSLNDLAPRLLGPSLGEKGARISSGEGGELGEPLDSGAICDDTFPNVINRWILVRNQSGEPYKLVLAVWQGDPSNGGALWVGGVEQPDGKREVLPNIPARSPALFDDYSREDEVTSISIDLDAKALTNRFTQHLESQIE